MKKLFLSVIACAMLSVSSFAQTINNLTPGTAVSGTDIFPAYQGSNPATGVTAAQLKTYMPGTVTSIATGCQATGGTITTTGTISTQTVINDLSGSNPAITTGYCGQLENLDNSSAETPTIAVSGSTGFPQSWYTDLCNINTGAQTLTPASGTIGGAATYVLAAGTKAAPNCVRIISDAANTNYVLEFPPGSGGGGASLTVANTFTTSGAASTPSQFYSGAPYSGGSGTTTEPMFLFQPSASSAITNWSTNGTVLGMNMPSGFGGRLIDFRTPFGSAFQIDNGGNIQANNITLNTANVGVTHNVNAGNPVTEVFVNQNTTNQMQIQVGNDKNNNEGSLTMSGSAFATTGLRNVLQVNGGDATNGGGVELLGQTTPGMLVGTLGAITLYNQPTTGTITYGVCAASGANGSGGGALILDTSVTVCGLSAKWAKNPIGVITPDQASEALDKLPVGAPVWAYKKSVKPGDHPRVGLYADDVAAMDERCAEYDSATHKIKNYDDRCVIAYLVADRQKMQAEIKDLQARVH